MHLQLFDMIFVAVHLEGWIDYAFRLIKVAQVGLSARQHFQSRF